MKRILLLIPFVFLFHYASADSGSDSLLTKLNSVLDKKKVYDAGKLARIDSLKKLLTANNADLNKRYDINLMLYNEYKSFNYKEANNYSQKLQQIGRLLNDPVKIAYGKIKLGFILLSSGMFKEAFDSLKTVKVGLLPDSAKTEYYFLTARTYYDLADFDKDDYYSPIYNERASRYIDSGVMLCKPNSFEYIYYNGLKFLKNGNEKTAVVNLKSLIEHYKLTYHQFAVTASTLSDLYIRDGQPDSAINLLMQAAIADVKSSTKEAAAMLNLAQLLHKSGDIKNAYVFIKQAMDDAIYYGARQRKLQVSAILPIIAGETINSVEKQRLALFFYGLILTILLVIIYKQLQKLKQADKAIMDANHNLQETNHKLNEANTIKEEYIGYYFNLISEYINKLEKFKRSVDNKLVTKRYDDIGILVNNINLTKEREELFINFDKAFLKIFPNFVDGYNALFSEENRVKLLPNQLLNTDLRIFALVRLGINDTEKISHILEYSVNTIYNYKTRIKSKSNVHNDEFENAIMAIKAI